MDMTFSEMMLQATSASDVAVDDPGALPVCEPLEKCRSKDLRREVYRLKLRVVRKGPDTNDHKNGYIALLRAHWKYHPLNDELVEGGTSCELLGTRRLPSLDCTTARPSTLVVPPTSYAPSLPVSPLFSKTQFKSDTTSLPAGESLTPPVRISPLVPLPPGSPTPLVESERGNKSTVAKPSPHALTPSQASVVSDYTTDAECDSSQSNHSTDESDRVQNEECASCSETDQPVVPQRSPRISTNVVEDEIIENPLVEDSSQQPPNRCREDFDAMANHTQYWESRLVVSKRKIHELIGEIEGSDQDNETCLLEDELCYYRRERKRALCSLWKA